MTDQTSAIRFIEDNWLKGQRIGQGSSIAQTFDFSAMRTNGRLILDSGTGEQMQ